MTRITARKESSPSGIAWFVVAACSIPSCTKTDAAAQRPRSETQPGPSSNAAAKRAPAHAVGSEWAPDVELETQLNGLELPRRAAKNLSDGAVLQLGKRSFLIVVSDEGHEFGVVALRPGGAAKRYDLATLPNSGRAVSLPAADSKTELDLESVAIAGERVLLGGSASLKRAKTEAGKGTGNIIPASGAGLNYADFVYELRAALGSDDFPSFEVSSAQDTRALLRGLPELAPYQELPNEDNGLDIEGQALHGGYVYLGLRGPLRDGKATIVRAKPDFSAPVAFRFDLQGLGVRALSSIEGAGARSGLYVLAGPVTTAEERFAIYRWAGASQPHAAQVVGQGSDLVLLGAAPSRSDARPEGLFYWRTRLCTLSDGLPGGAPRCRTLL